MVAKKEGAHTGVPTLEDSTQNGEEETDSPDETNPTEPEENPNLPPPTPANITKYQLLAIISQQDNDPFLRQNLSEELISYLSTSKENESTLHPAEW